MNKCSLTVLFITLNEEYHIGAAIDNVKDLAEEIIVVDSGSTDRTVAIAEEKDAKVVYHKFENFGAQWNFALSVPIVGVWTMKMDPDEQLTSELKDEIRQHLTSGDADGYSFDRVLWFMGQRLRGVRNEVVRIWRSGQCRFSEVAVNEHPIVTGRVRKLKGTMDHLDSQNLEHWLCKQNGYSTREAEMKFRGEKLSATPKFWGSKLERRMWLKRIFFHIPGRYLMHNFLLFFVKGAWKSGRAGWYWVKCREMVMRLREYKYLEMCARNEGKHL